MNTNKLWTKDFCVISLVNFFLYFTFNLLIATITIYASEKFHASQSIAGLSSGIFIIGSFIGRISFGRMIEKIENKKAMFIGFILYIITTALYFVANNIFLLLIIRMLNGIGFGVTSSASSTIAAKIIPNERRGEGIGYFAMSATIAAAVGPFSGMFISQHFNYSTNFLVCVFSLSVCFIISFSLKIPYMNLTSKEAKKSEGFKIGSFFEAKAIPISIIVAIMCFSYSSILSFLAAYAKELHLGDIASFFFIVYSMAILLTRPVIGRWFDKKGENFVIYPTFFIFAFALMLLSQAHNGIIILLAGALAGTGCGNFFSSAQALAIKVSPGNRTDLATSTFFIFMDLGAGIGPFILGLFIPIMGLRGVYAAMAIVALSCSVLYYCLHGKKKRKEFVESIM